MSDFIYQVGGSLPVDAPTYIKRQIDSIISLNFSVDDFLALIWNREGELLHILNGHEDYILSISWSPDGKILASGSKDKTIKLYVSESDRTLCDLN